MKRGTFVTKSFFTSAKCSEVFCKEDLYFYQHNNRLAVNSGQKLWCTEADSRGKGGAEVHTDIWDLNYLPPWDIHNSIYSSFKFTNILLHKFLYTSNYSSFSQSVTPSWTNLH